MAQRALQMRHLPLMLLPGTRSYFQRRVATHVDALNRLYPAIAEVTESRVIVDASKSPTYAYLLGLVPSVDLHVIHLVRDPRGVQYSILRRKDRGDERFQNHSVVKSTLLWDVLNVSEELLRLRTGERYMRLRYEEFARDPLGVLANIAQFIGESDAGTPAMVGDAFTLATNHTANGSNSRFETGPTRIRVDDAWQTDMEQSDRSLVTRLTVPLLRRYGYRRSVTPRVTDASQGSVRA